MPNSTPLDSNTGSNASPTGGTRSVCLLIGQLLLSYEYRILTLGGHKHRIQNELRKMAAIRIEVTSEKYVEELGSIVNSVADESDDDKFMSDNEAAPILDSMTEEMLFCRSVNSYLTYLSSLATEVVIAQPNLLKSNETIKYEELLNYNDMDDLVRHITEKKITELSYSGIKALEEFFKSRMDLRIFSNEMHRRVISLSIEIRNIYTHNYGLVNSTFQKRVPDFDIDLGERFPLTKQIVKTSEAAIMDAAIKLDKQAISKFSLKTLSDSDKEDSADS